MLVKLFPQAAEYLPDDDGVAQAEEKMREETKAIHEEMKGEGKKEGKTGRQWALGSLLKTLEALLPLLASKVDWRSLINHVMHGAYGKTKEGGHNGHKPEVSVADAGTVKAQDFENFE